MNFWEWLKSLWSRRVAPGPVVAPPAAPATIGMLGPHNEARRVEAAPPLRGNAILERMAMAQASECARLRVMTHYGPDGSGIGTRAKRAGYDYREVEENADEGTSTPDEAVAAWLGDPPHRANVLDPFMTEMGAGMSIDERGVKYWVAVYGAPR